MKEEIRNLTIEEFWQKYSDKYDKDKGEFDCTYSQSVVMFIGDFYEDRVDRDMLICSNYQNFELSQNEYFDEDEDYLGYDYSVCAMREGIPVEYEPDAKMSDVFDYIYYEAEERYLEMKDNATSITD
ncbi:MAG: hypothetical protein J6R01_04500 [Alistipes sp.]|nr:hypothetical protein [Alistipes sp.]